MEAIAQPSMYTQHLDPAQPQVPDGAQVNNHDHHTLPVIDGTSQFNDRRWSAAETVNWTEGSEFMQAAELDVDVGLASMNLNDDTGTSVLTATVTPSLSPSPFVDTTISAGLALNACVALKNELDAALNVYKQCREVMLWHAANVCRVNVEYIYTLQVANRVQG